MKIGYIVVAIIIIALGAAFYLYPDMFSFTTGGGGGVGVGPANDSGIIASPDSGLIPPASEEKGLGVLSGRARYSGEAPDFSLIEIAVYNPETNGEVGRTKLGSDGSYAFNLPTGEYVLDIVEGTGSSTNLPRRMFVGAGETITANFQLSQ